MTFAIDLKRDEIAGPDEPRGIRIAAGGAVFTRLTRYGQIGDDEFLQAPPAQLAFWLVDNWWRIRWEGPDGQALPDWRLAHELSAIGGGYAWPQLTLCGVDGMMECQGRADPVGVMGSVRYVTSAKATVSATSFEAAVRDFVEICIDPEVTSDAPALQAAWRALLAERADPELTAWRRLEARLGFDPDKAPPALMEELRQHA